MQQISIGLEILFIAQYGQGKNYVTLGDYLTARDKLIHITWHRH